MPACSRRVVLRTGALALGVGIAGCSGGPATYPEDPSGPVHVDLKNCAAGEKAVDVTLTVRRLGGDVVHDVTHTVPDGFCSDMGETYTVYEVWPEPGRYRVHAETATTGATFDAVLRVDPTSTSEYEAELRLVAVESTFEVTLGESAERVTDAPTPTQNG